MISLPEMLLRLTISMLLGSIIGWERESSEHHAGVRTSALVALGTTLFTILSAYGFHDLLTLPHVQFDPTRIASYIVAGIGFLGGGAIYFRQDLQKVRGLTSAASVWAVAAIGMACGIGFLIEAAITTFMVLFILIGMRYVEARLLPYKSQHLQELFIRLDGEDEGTLIGKIYDTLSKMHINIVRVDIRSQKTEQGSEHMLEIDCQASDERTMIQAIDQLRTIKGVLGIKSSSRKGVRYE
ncbi:MgtC/SapB family protein [Dictyobacter formicarum]|uniref:MgtC family membrane protein n=1 Tax=Dictyobacter formicarum TaxID=2778368 RepID=A0ABQ3VJW0_9CHLR|nr:MgtC/SapB family protein [Dictyobacter formicarum]GHO85969.1 MgtC family membrane protein [Dictyobacter formicarum]